MNKAKLKTYAPQARKDSSASACLIGNEKQDAAQQAMA